MGPKLTRRERGRLMQFLRAYKSCFAFNMKEVGALIGPGIWIKLANDMLIFCLPYRYNDMERDLIRSRTLDLLKAGLVELSHGEYASTTVMPTKKIYMATTWISGCVERIVLLIGRLSSISMPCLHLRRSLMLWDMRGSLVHLIFRQGTINCRFERRTKPRLYFEASTLTARIVYISGSSYPLG
jgi:hypothetical protein